MNIETLKQNPIFIIIGILIVIVILYVVYFYQKSKYEEKNPVFKRLTHFGKDPETIKAAEIPVSESDSQVTLTVWIYVDNLTYKYGEEKNIMTKGQSGSGAAEQCPGIYIHPKMNNLIIKFTMKTGKLKHILIEDFPIRKWFLLAIVVQGFQVDFYMDGDLLFSKYLESTVKFNNGDLLLCQEGGFHGRISCIQYFPRVVYPKLLKQKYATGPACVPWFQSLWESMVGNLGDALGNFDIQVNIEMDPDQAEYEEKKNEMCEGETIKDLGAVSLDEAKAECDKESNCDCITYMQYSYGLLPEGNMRLVNNYLTGDRTSKEDGFTAYTVKRSLFSNVLNTAGQSL